MKLLRRLLPVILVLFTVLPLKSQDHGSRPKIKSLVVTEEKYDMLVKKQYKESETYYNQKGNTIEEISYKQGKINRHFGYKYDADGNKIKEEEYDPSGKLTEYSEYKIENGLRVEKSVFGADGKIKSKKYYVYTTF